jgi:Sap, sulfolipid-1-addressing protein
MSARTAVASSPMSTWLELLVLAFASMFWPTLILIVVLALRVPQPVKILIWFLAGGLLTTISIGIAIVFLLQDGSFVSGSHPPADPALDIIIGLLSLLAAFALNHKGAKASPEPRPTSSEPPGEKKPSMAERAVGRGGGVAFAAGIVLNIVPGTFPIIALKDIAQLDVGDGAKVATIVVFYVIMFAFIEVPIVAYLFAPERTTVAVNDFNAWLGRNGRRLGVYVLGGVGLYLLVRGIIELF